MGKQPKLIFFSPDANLTSLISNVLGISLHRVINLRGNLLSKFKNNFELNKDKSTRVVFELATSGWRTIN